MRVDFKFYYEDIKYYKFIIQELFYENKYIKF